MSTYPRHGLLFAVFLRSSIIKPFLRLDLLSTTPTLFSAEIWRKTVDVFAPSLASKRGNVDDDVSLRCANASTK
jgi:hypothetical protein